MIDINKYLEVAKAAYEAGKERRKWEEAEKLLLEELKEISKNESFVAENYKFSKFERKGTIDYKQIEVLQDMDLEQYRKPSTIYWKLEGIL